MRWSAQGYRINGIHSHLLFADFGSLVVCKKPFSIFSRILLYVHLCTHVYAGVYACGGQSVSSSVTLHLTFWDRVSHWTWRSAIWLGRLASDINESAPILLNEKWSHLGFFSNGAGDLNSAGVFALQQVFQQLSHLSSTRLTARSFLLSFSFFSLSPPSSLFLPTRYFS